MAIHNSIKRNGSIASSLSSDSEFDEDDDTEETLAYTWLGRRLKSLVNELRNQESRPSFNRPDENNFETNDMKVSSGYALIKNKRHHRSVRFRRRCVLLFAWTILLFNLILVVSLSIIQLVVKYQRPRTFGWRKVLHILDIPFWYENSCRRDSNRVFAEARDCNRFRSEMFCPIAVGLSTLQLIFTIPYTILLLPIGITFMLVKKSRPYLKTLVSILSSAVVFICLFYLSRTVLMYRHVYLELENNMKEEMDASSKVVTQWWEETQREGKCCGIRKPQDWNNKFLGPSQSSSSQTASAVYPGSCCDHTKSTCSKLPSISEIYTDGCYEREVKKIHLYAILTLAILILSAMLSPLLKFMFYFIGRITKKYIGRKTGNLRTNLLRCEVYGILELVGFNKSANSTNLVFFGKDILPTDQIKARVNHLRIFKVIVQRKRKVVARIKVRSIAQSEKNPMGRKSVVYKMANDLQQGIILIKF